MFLPSAALVVLASLSAAANAPDVGGCWELARAGSVSVHDPDPRALGFGTAFLGKEIVRCLEPDGGVIERRTVTFSSPLGGRARESMHSGTWSARAGVLEIEWEDGSGGKWEFEPFDGGADIGGELWRRLDLDPAALGAEAGGADPDGEAALASEPDEPAAAGGDEEDEERCEDGGCDEEAVEGDAAGEEEL